jgi:O-antigen/teichoic acid export membrane protein
VDDVPLPPRPDDRRNEPKASSESAPENEAVGALGRVASGTLALGLSAVVSVLGQFLIVPVALRVWGAEVYGEWVSLTALVTSLTLTDLGVQTYVVNRMCAHHARGDTTAVLRDMHSALRVQLPVVLGLLVVGALGFGLLPMGAWLGFRTVSALGLFATLFFLAAEILFWVPMGVVAGTYRAAGKLARAALIQAVYRMGQFVLPIGLIAFGAPFAWVAFARFALSLAIFAWVLWDLGRVYPWFRLYPLGGSLREGARMLGPGSLFLLLGLSDYAAVQGTIMVLQGRLGGAEVALFATHRTLVNTARTFSGLVTSAAWPEITALDARGDSTSLARVHRSLSKLNGWFVGALLLGFLPLAAPLYTAWTLKALTVDGVTMAILAAQTILWGFYRGGATVLRRDEPARSPRAAALRERPRRGGRHGAAGADVRHSRRSPGGLAGELLVASWLVPRAASRAFGEGFGVYLRATLPTALLGLGLPALVGGAAYFLLPPPWLNVTVALVVGTALGLVALRALLAPRSAASPTRPSRPCAAASRPVAGDTLAPRN